MSYSNQIRNLAFKLLGNLEEEYSSLLSAVSVAAEQELSARLRPNVTPQMCEDCFILAGALLCISTLRQLSASGLSDFTAGTMKITFAEDRSELAKMAFRMLQPWLNDGFVFCGVPA